MEVPSVFSYKRRRKNERSLFERKKLKIASKASNFCFIAKIVPQLPTLFDFMEYR